MAAFRKMVPKSILCSYLSQSSTGYLSSSSLRPPSTLLLQRGLAYKLYVAGLSFYTTDKALQEAFSQYGQVVEATVMMDRVSNRSKGFGFVTYASEDEADKAINEMNGKVLHGRIVCVELAKARTPFSARVPIARGPPEPPTSQDP